MLQIRPVALLFILKTNTTSPMMPVMTSVCLMFVVLFIIINAKWKQAKGGDEKSTTAAALLFTANVTPHSILFYIIKQ